MKLLYCEYCQDLFTLSCTVMRSCECGRVKGRYINEREAEVSQGAISIAISNQALMQAIYDMRFHQALTGDKAGRSDYRQADHGRIEDVWVRPNTGPGNPHTRLLGDEAGTSDHVLPDDQTMPTLAEHVTVQQEAATIIRLVLGARNERTG